MPIVNGVSMMQGMSMTTSAADAGGMHSTRTALAEVPAEESAGAKKQRSLKMT